MTARRASFLGLIGLVFAFWTAVVSCSLDTSPYGETGDVCTAAAHCDDLDVCTEDSCNAEGLCVHVAAPDGVFSDGAQGNCKVLQCQGGEQSVVASEQDVDDGNECTEDSCDGSTALHTVISGAPCQFQGGLSTCDGDGNCVPPDCGHLGADGVEVGCADDPSDCTLSYCDKAKGKCVLEALDGVPVPGGPAVSECGGKYCVAGVEDDQLAPVGSPCALFGGDPGDPGMCDTAGACVQCIDKADCDDGIPESPCHSFSCVTGKCFVTTQPDGPLPAQPVGDCHLQICSNGLYTNQIDNADIPFDDDPCTNDLCTGGTPSNPPAAVNTPCGAGDLLYCDGMGTCKGCITDAQCLGLTDCKTPVCNTDTDECGFTYQNAGTTVSMQIAGDCKTIVCDGNGNMVNQYQSTDPQDDGNDCTTDTCTAMDMTSHTPVSSGSTCNDNGGVVCDAVAHCVGKPCATPADCPMGTQCVDGVCCESTCGGTCNACSSLKKGGGQNGLCGPIMTGDPDGTDCPGNSGCSNGACQPLPTGAVCVGVVAECTSGFCADNICCGTACNGTCQACNLAGMAGMCSNVPNLQDPANECAAGACNGAGACKLDNGQSCGGMASNCLSGICVDGVCCGTACNGTCQACNLAGTMGTCTSVPNLQDPANECAAGACNGGGQCKLDNGQACNINGDCLNGSCADGVCCNSACSTTCMACSSAKTGGANGTCANVTNMTDPDNECTLTTSCNGAGACAKHPNGTACTMNGECNSNLCVDGVCCGTACSGTCQACNVAGSLGTCSNVPNLMDPANECANGACNGAAACKLDDGQVCAAGSACLSAICADGRCCNNTCSGTCESCNQAATLGTCTPIANGTDPGNECAGTTNCNGMSGCTKLANGATCTQNAECTSMLCVDGVCCGAACGGLCESCNQAATLGTCTPIANGTDPGNECAGTTNCNGMSGCTKLANGATCTQNAECTSMLCADGVCCGTACGGLCESCNQAAAPGTCTFVPAGQDPIDECAGATVCGGTGTCKKANGASCSMNGADASCASGQCADGVCCNMACSGSCEACTAALTGGTNGTCADIPANTDPANECTGAQVCSIMGTCAGGPDGASCMAGGECGSTFCVDGVCCDSLCSGTCQACSTFKKVVGANGVCGNIVNSDPDSECLDAQICNAGACIGAPNGVACSAGAECASTHCVDSVCCDTTCTGPCQACSAFKKQQGTSGTCGNIASNGDPDDECPGPQLCDGMGDCFNP